MKPALIFSLIALSFGANAALVWQLRRPAGGDTDASGRAASASATGQAASVAAKKSANAKAAGDGKVPGETWAALQSDGDLPGLVARLRAAGYPKHVIAVIVSQAVNEQNAARWKELTLPPVNGEYWTTRLPGVSAASLRDPAVLAARRKLSLEQSNQIKELIGSTGVEESPEYLASQRRQYGNLSADKIAQVQDIVRDYQELTQQVRADMQGVTLPEDREKLAFVEAERRKDLAKIMSPEEFDEYMMRTSSTASSVRSQLSAMNPTEQEFRAIYKLQETFDDQFGPNSPNQRGTQESAQARNAAQKQLLEDIKGLLGPERGAEYERSRDYTYQSAVNIVRRLDLPKENAVTVFELQKETQQRTAELQRDRSLNAEQRQAQLAALSAEVHGKVTAALGERGAAAYQESGGFWLRNIVPPQPGAGPVPIPSTTTVIQSNGATIIMSGPANAAPPTPPVIIAP